MKLFHYRIIRLLIVLTLDVSVAVAIAVFFKTSIFLNILIALVWVVAWLINDIKEVKKRKLEEQEEE
jgi:hypothetical protein